MSSLGRMNIVLFIVTGHLADVFESFVKRLEQKSVQLSSKRCLLFLSFKRVLSVRQKHSLLLSSALFL